MSDPFETVIGLEVHVQLDTRTKLFCGCRNEFGSPPNSHLCPVCYGLPGALPVPNVRAVELAVLAGLALDCEINEESVFERKHYFYPDLPKGYQITQYEFPLAEAGSVHIRLEAERDGEAVDRNVGINRIQIEEDAGKLVHDGFPGSDKRSGVDFNRAGVPLIEIVSDPDMRSAAEAVAYARELRSRIVYCGVSDADMEKGNLRMDGNVSVRRRGDLDYGVKVELKNLNSFRFLQRALEYEERRQREVLTGGRKVVQETRLYDEARGVTEPMRSKEEAEDYRYFPDPDLPPLRLPEGLLEASRGALPEFPRARAARYRSEHGIAADQAGRIAGRRDLADYYEATVAAATGAGSPVVEAAAVAGGWITTEVASREKQDGRLAAPPERLGELVHLLAAKELPRNAAREVFQAMCDTGRSARELMAELGFADLAAGSRLDEIATRLVAAHPADRDAYRAGKKKVIGFFVGQLMRELRGKADAREARAALERALDGDSGES
ncbi:MAG: Asp-tRNA(Asn)/Glu-tRNA(Gln) amidotransferase subunit GatB [Acidobacteria bacterium]|nr:Asp-tRNA(Asn)/Glu-tRNA(Gln) amidotransferase subunit GatB [Acidobacteriota bacterium]MYK79468.1 Asp-tRNA(Asn)/Glu-tRNA(Gln) amidotransferase subunit GatB [Acidobacteriota bacterium]